MRPSPSVAPEGDRSGVGPPPGRSAHFNIFLDATTLDRLGCEHGRDGDETLFAQALLCRACSVAYEIRSCVHNGEFASFRLFYVRATGAQQATGIADTPRARFVVSRMLALAQHHRDPIEVMLADGREDELNAMDVFIPTWALAAAYLREWVGTEAFQANT